MKSWKFDAIGSRAGEPSLRPHPHSAVLFEYVVDRLNFIPGIQKARLAPLRLLEFYSFHQASLAIQKRVDELQGIGINVGEYFLVNDQSLNAKATLLANLFSMECARREGEPKTLPANEKLVSWIGLPSRETDNPRRWFKRVLLRHERQVCDYFNHCMRVIGKDGSAVVSDAVLESRLSQIKAQKAYAKAHRLVSGVISLPFSDFSNNQKKRAAKATVRATGLDKYCLKDGLESYFLTLTLPPKFHPNPANGNSSWDGSTPLDGHAEMQKKWRFFQRRFGEGILGKCLGVRVEEPHNDGCIHWHLLIYISPERETEFKLLVGKVFGGVTAAKIVPIDRKLSSGCSYLLKYLLPSLVDVDARTGRSSASKASLYDAHKSTWGGRSIQFFDVPGSATVWDEIRRIKEGSFAFRLLSKGAFEMYRAACSNDYCTFLEELVKLKEQNRFQLTYKIKANGTRLLCGLEIDGIFLDTRLEKWVVLPVTHEGMASAADS